MIDQVAFWCIVVVLAAAFVAIAAYHRKRLSWRAVVGSLVVALITPLVLSAATILIVGSLFGYENTRGPFWGVAVDRSVFGCLAFAALLFLGNGFYMTVRQEYLARQRQRPVKRGLCPKCAYDLRGSDSQSCPECGATVSQPAAIGSHQPHRSQ